MYRVGQRWPVAPVRVSMTVTESDVPIRYVDLEHMHRCAGRCRCPAQVRSAGTVGDWRRSTIQRRSRRIPRRVIVYVELDGDAVADPGRRWQCRPIPGRRRCGPGRGALVRDREGEAVGLGRQVSWYWNRVRERDSRHPAGVDRRACRLDTGRRRDLELHRPGSRPRPLQASRLPALDEVSLRRAVGLADPATTPHRHCR